MGLGVVERKVPPKKKALTTDEVVQASCSHGT
jgi:hypothetical protein